MQRLFRRILHFSLFLLLVIVVICIVVRYFLSRVSEETVTGYRGMSTLILGDSHPRAAVLVDSIDGSFNLSLSDERFTYSRIKLRLSSEDSLNNIQLVILGVSYHSFSRWRTYDADFDYRFLFSFYPLIRKEIEQLYQEEFPSRIITDIKRCYEWGCLSRNTIPELRWIIRKTYEHKAIDKVIAPIPIEWEARIDQQFYENCSHLPLQPFHPDINALRNIQELCRHKGYALVLYNAPISRDYYQNIPPFYKHLTDSIISSVVDNQTTFYIDHSQYPLPDSCFRNCDHVNIYGANIVTPLLRDSLRSLGILPASHAL
jgi:hypothetical protein